MRHRRVVLVEGAVGRDREPDPRDVGIRQTRALLIELDLLAEPKHRGIGEEGYRTGQVEKTGSAGRKIDVLHRLERHTDDETKHLAPPP